MDSFEFNKIAGAVLGTALLTFGLGELSGIIYHEEKPDKQGFAIEVAEATTTEGTAEAGGGATQPVALADLLKNAHADKGAAVAKKCAACHNFEKGSAAKVGPSLWNVVERPIASFPNFTYSDAMVKHAGKPWTFEELNAFLTKPSAFAPGTKMQFAGLKDADRANMLAYLQSLSDSPKPFPAP